MTQPEKTARGGDEWAVLALTSLPLFAVVLDTTLLYVAFDDLRRSFSAATDAQLSWVLNAYTIVSGTLLVVAGRVADRVGRKRAFVWGLVVFTVSSALSGMAPTPALLIAARVFQAVGAAVLVPTSLALVLAAFPKEKRPIAVSIWSAVQALAAAVGPALGSAIVQTVGWRWAFFVNVPIGIFAALGARSRLRESQQSDVEPLPGPWPILFAIGAPGLLALGVIGAGNWGPTSAITLAALTGSAVLFALLVTNTRRARVPMIDPALFRDQNYRVAAWGIFVFNIVFTAMFFGQILFLTRLWGYSIMRAGLAMTPGPLTVIPSAIIAGRIAAKRGHRGLLVLGGVLYAAAALNMFLRVTSNPEYLTLLLPNQIILGATIGLIFPSLSGVAVHGLSPDRFALGVAVNSAVRAIGSVLGVAIVVGFVARGGTMTLAGFKVLQVVLMAGGLLTAWIGSSAQTAPGVAPRASGGSRPRRGRQAVLPVLAAGSLVFSVVHVVRAQRLRVHPAPVATTVDASTSGERISATGIVEPSSENIHVGSNRSGVVTVVNVSAQDTVKTGAPLFCLDDRAAVADLHAREADLTMARAQLDRLVRMPRAEELPPLAARAAQERARLADLDDQLRRTTTLVDRGALPSEQTIRIGQQREQAASAVQAAQAELDLKRAGSWAPDRGVAQAAVEQATSSLERARTEVDLLCARAPVASTVLRVDVHVGEFVSTTTQQDLMTLGVVEPLYLRVDIDEPDIPRFVSESRAEAVPRGETGAIPLRFVRTEPLVQPKRWLSGASTERVDTRVLQALYAVEGRAPMTRLFVGQQLDVHIGAARAEQP